MSREANSKPPFRRAEPLVRLAVVTDAECIARIYNQHVDLGGSTFDTTHWSETQVRQQMAVTGPEAWLVAVEGDSVLGWASARWYSQRHGYRYTLETAIYVDARNIGTGIATSLQESLERHCAECGIHHLVAKIAANNARSLAFHYRHGYELVGVQKEIGHMDGGWKDVAILQKLLPQMA